MSPSAQLIPVQLKEIIEDEKMTDQGAREVQEQVDGEEIVDPDNTSLVLSTVPNTINNKFDHECLDAAVRLRNAYPIGQSTNNTVRGHKNTIPGLHRTMCLAHHVRSIWFIVRRWVWDSVPPGALVADEMGLGKTFTSAAAAMICKLPTDNVAVGLPLSILCGNTRHKWVNMELNKFPRIIGDKHAWYLLQRQTSLPCLLSEIKSTPLQGHRVLTSAFELILVVTMPRVAKMFKSVIDEMTYGTDCELIHLLHVDNGYLTQEDLNTNIEEPENRCRNHLVSYDTSTSRAKPSSKGQLSHCSWWFGFLMSPMGTRRNIVSAGALH